MAVSSARAAAAAAMGWPCCRLARAGYRSTRQVLQTPVRLQRCFAGGSPLVARSADSTGAAGNPSVAPSGVSPAAAAVAVAAAAAATGAAALALPPRPRAGRDRLVGSGRSPSRCVGEDQSAAARVQAFYLRPDEDELPLLAAAAGNNPAVDLGWGQVLPAEARGIQVLITRHSSGEELDALAPSLEALLVPFAGITEDSRALLRARPHLTLHNCHFNAVSTAELAVALLLAVAKRVIDIDGRLRREASSGAPWTLGWRDPVFDCPKLAGRTALVLGYGAVGARVAKVLHAFGLEVLAVRRRGPTSPSSDGVALLHGPAALPSLLPRTDVVVVCLPGTAGTAGLLGRAELRALPRGAMLVNVGRGSVVDEAALYEALADGHLRGAGLDVWYNYPELGFEAARGRNGPASQPFHELGNVVMSPHRGQSTDSKAQDRVQELLQLLGARARTGQLPNRFDLAAGY